MITPDQCRAARAMLNWSQTKFASKASIARATLAEFESGKRVPILNNLNSIQNTFVQEGIEFIPENGGGAGVRLRNSNNMKV